MPGGPWVPGGPGGPGGAPPPPVPLERETRSSRVTRAECLGTKSELAYKDLLVHTSKHYKYFLDLLGVIFILVTLPPQKIIIIIIINVKVLARLWP